MNKPIEAAVVVIKEEEEAFILPCDREVVKRESEREFRNNIEAPMEAFGCLLCPVIFITRLSLDAHIHNVHSGIKNSFACALCKKKLVSKAGLKKHDNLIHKKIRPYSCSQCNYTATSPILINKHHFNIHVKKYKCTACNYTNISRKALASHVYTAHERTFKLYCCRATFSDTEKLNEHIRISHEILHCKECQYECLSIDNLKHHKMTVHDKFVICSCKPGTCDRVKFKIFSCTTLPCTFASLTKSALEDHVTQIHG